MRFHVDIETDGPVTASAVRDAIEHAIDRHRLNVGLSADDDEGSVTGFTVVQANEPNAKPIRIKCTTPQGAISYVTQDTRRGWSCTLSDGTPANLSYAGILGNQMGAAFELVDAVGSGDVLATMRRLGSKNWTYELV